MEIKELIYLVLFCCIILFMLNRIIKWYKRRKKVAQRGPKATSSRAWRETYMERLPALLGDPLKDNLKEIYSLTFGPADENTYTEIVKCIETQSYNRLAEIMAKVPMYVDDFGENIQGNIYDVLGIIDRQDNYYIAIIHVEYINKYDLKLKSIIKVNSFNLNIFKSKRLVYPV